MSQITVSAALVRFLENLGIDCIFGMPGAHILPVYDALRASSIRVILAKHEQGAAFMAGGYARASGRIGACIATAGPGATNLITGIANAQADRLPVLAITGETSTHIFGKGGLQESSGEGGSIDQIALFKPITRYQKLVERTDYLASVFKQCARALRAETPGPALLSLPYNIQKETLESDDLNLPTLAVRSHSGIDEERVARLAALLLNARQPVILAGEGCIRAYAQDELTRLSTLLNIPVASSLKAKGAIDEDSPLALGSLGVTSSGHAYEYIRGHADLLIILGASFNERTSYLWDSALSKDRRLVQVDRDPEQLDKAFNADLTIQGDIKAVLGALLTRLEGREANSDVARCMGAEIDHSKSTVGKDYALFQSGFALVESFFQRLRTYRPGGIALFDDNIIFAQNFFNVARGTRYYPNSGISSLGHAIPAALGARLVDPRPTFAILGDGGFQMCAMELMTAVNHDVPLNVVVFNNGTMGLIRKNQHQQYGQRYISCDFIGPDLGLLARSFGIAHRRVEHIGDIDAVFSELDLENGINLIEIVLDKNLFPNYSSRR